MGSRTSAEFGVLVWAVGLLSACAAPGPGDGSVMTPPPDGQARIVFLRTRDSVLYVARRAAISIDGETVGRTAFGRFHAHDVPAGPHSLGAGMWDVPGACVLTLTAAAGETYYFQVDPRAESLGAFASASFFTELVTENLATSLAVGFGAVAAESYAAECGGAFRLYPVDPEGARAKLSALKPAG